MLLLKNYNKQVEKSMIFKTQGFYKLN